MDAQAVGGKQEPAPTVCCHVDMQASFFVGFFFLKRLVFQQLPKGKMVVTILPIF